MKKPIILLAAVAAAACTLSGCKFFRSEGEKHDDYENLNSMLALSYSKIELTVKDTFVEEDITLESDYTIIYYDGGITIDYSVERFAEISLENPSDELIITLSGTATIVDGVVTGGEDAGITADLADTQFTFKKEYFQNATLTGLYFKADVKNASAFLGVNLNCTDMKVYAEFLNKFYNIEISYTAESGNKVEYKYVFTR